MTGALKSSVVCKSASQSTDYPGPDHSASPILIICDKLCHSCFFSLPGDAAHPRYHYSRAIAERNLFHPVGRTLTVFSTFQLWIYIRTQTARLVARGFICVWRCERKCRFHSKQRGRCSRRKRKRSHILRQRGSKCSWGFSCFNWVLFLLHFVLRALLHYSQSLRFGGFSCFGKISRERRHVVLTACLFLVAILQEVEDLHLWRCF